MTSNGVRLYGKAEYPVLPSLPGNLLAQLSLSIFTVYSQLAFFLYFLLLMILLLSVSFFPLLVRGSVVVVYIEWPARFLFAW